MYFQNNCRVAAFQLLNSSNLSLGLPGCEDGEIGKRVETN